MFAWLKVGANLMCLVVFALIAGVWFSIGQPNSISTDVALGQPLVYTDAAEANPVQVGSSQTGTKRSERTSPLVDQQDASPQNNDLLIVERDTLQSRNLMPIINHMTMITNLSAKAQNLAIHSAVPPELDQVGAFWPKFGRDSQLELPVFPEDISTSITCTEVHYLDKPEKMTDGTPGYRWNVDVAPQSAVVAQYDNYYGPADRFVAGLGELRILGLQITSHFQVNQVGDDIVMTMTIKLSNTSKIALHDLSMKLCFPETIVDLRGRQLVRLYHMVRYYVSPPAIYSQIGHADGFGNRVTLGHAATITQREFTAGETSQFVFEIHGKRTIPSGEIYPAHFITFRDIGADRIWPATDVFVEGKVAGTKRYYLRESSLFIPASWCFVLLDSTAAVVNPTTVKPTYAPISTKSAGGVQ